MLMVCASEHALGPLSLNPRGRIDKPRRPRARPGRRRWSRGARSGDASRYTRDMQWLTPLFILATLAGVALELWLSQRQALAVARHRAQVPAPFADSISAD